MRSIEEAVGNALDERDGDQRNHGIKGPLAQTLRRVAETGEQGLDRIACGRLRATRRSFEPAPPHGPFRTLRPQPRSEEHTSELQSLMRTSYAVFCLKKKQK